MNSAYTTQALLLKATDRGEDDRWVSLLTPDHGRVAALAKKARGSRRRFAGTLQPFCMFEAVLRPRGGGLCFLEGAAPKEFPLGNAPEWEGLASGWLFLELAELLCAPGEPQPLFFELVLGGLRRLGMGAEAPSAVRLSVIWGALELEGWAPDPGVCRGCGDPGPWLNVALDAGRGGLLCPTCRGAGPGAVPGEALGIWRRASSGLPLGVVPAPAEEAILRWLEYHIGKPLRTPAMFRGGPL